MNEKEKNISYLASRWVDEKFPPELDLKDWVKAHSGGKPEDVYLRNVISAADTIKQAEKLQEFEDQINFLKKANKSYISILMYFQELLPGELEVWQPKIGSKEWMREFKINNNVLLIVRGYIYDINKILNEKIEQSLTIHDKEEVDNALSDKKSVFEGKDSGFIGNKMYKLQWIGTEIQLIRLFENLAEKKLILLDDTHKWQIIAQHFINKNGEPFKPKQLSTVAQRSSPSEGKVIQIVHDISKESTG